MENKVFNEACRRWLLLDTQGELWLADGNSYGHDEWQAVRFHEQYAGYYPACRFTAIAADHKGFVAAATCPDESPVLFRSLMGGVWEQVPLLCGNNIMGYASPSSPIVSILADQRTEQLFLCCEGGEIVTLPDCVKCARLYRASTEKVKDAVWNKDGEISLFLKDGSVIDVSIDVLSQTRVRYGYVQPWVEKGAVLVDLRNILTVDTFVQPWGRACIGKGVRISEDELPTWLEGQPKEKRIFFFCDYGVRADCAAEYARGLGFSHACSLGGIKMPE